MKANNYQGVLQKPIGSGFTAMSTSTEVIKGINLNSKIAIVTGGNTGIGPETAKALSSTRATASNLFALKLDNRANDFIGPVP